MSTYPARDLSLHINSFPPFTCFLHSHYEIRAFCRNFANYFRESCALTILLQRFPN